MSKLGMLTTLQQVIGRVLHQRVEIRCVFYCVSFICHTFESSNAVIDKSCHISSQ